VVHPGLINDLKKIDPLQKFGKVTADSDHVETVFGHGPATDFENYTNDKKEMYYASRQHEPLGRSYVRGHVLPKKAQDSCFAFGVPTGASESSKNLLYPTVLEDESKHDAMYTKSHGTYAAGQQRDRKYDWDKAPVDPKSHRFGKKDKAPLQNGVLLCMRPGIDNAVPKTRITAKKVEDHKNTKDQLGRSRNLGLGSTGLPSDHVFGVRGTQDAWDGAACIQGNYSEEEQAPDADLGCSATPGWRNTSIETRAFGCPTLRTDVRYPAKKSVSDNQNYGDDVSAQYLLYPPQYASEGIEDEEFAKGRSKNKIRQIFEQASLLPAGFSDELFEKVWDNALGYDLNENGVGVSEFQSALNDYVDAKDSGNLDQWNSKQSQTQSFAASRTFR
jgi:hypothetical protein